MIRRVVLSIVKALQIAGHTILHESRSPTAHPMRRVWPSDRVRPARRTGRGRAGASTTNGKRCHCLQLATGIECRGLAPGGAKHGNVGAFSYCGLKDRVNRTARADGGGARAVLLSHRSIVDAADIHIFAGGDLGAT